MRCVYFNEAAYDCKAGFAALRPRRVLVHLNLTCSDASAEEIELHVGMQRQQ